MKKYNVVVEKCSDTGLYVGYVPGLQGAHSQGKTLDELLKNLKEVISLVVSSKRTKFKDSFVGVQAIEV